MKRIFSILLTILLIMSLLPVSAFAVSKPKGSFSSITFTKSETRTFQMKCFNGFTVKSCVTLTLSASCGFEIAGDLVVENGAKLVGKAGKGDFTFATGPETTITGIDLYYRHDNRDGSPIKTLKWPCTLQYAREHTDIFKDGFVAKFKWDDSIPGWVLTDTLNSNPFHDPALIYHQQNAKNLATKTAGKLNSLGLFAGVGKNADGSTNYDLWRKGSRIEALVMLIKLLGYDAEVQDRNALVQAGEAVWDCPFEDVKAKAAWAIPYVAFAKEKGLTAGKSSTEFGLGDVTYQQYCCFLLNALGYTNDNFPGSNIWTECIKEAESIGLCACGTPDNICTLDSMFWRADMVLMSWQVLNARVKDETNQMLHEKLSEKGLFTMDFYHSIDK